MNRATLIVLGLVCLSGCESTGGNSLAAFGPNTIPPQVRQAGTDPYYTAASAAPAATPTATAATAATNPPASAPSTATASLAPTTPSSGASAAPSTTPLPLTSIPSTVSSNEPPVRIVEREGVVPSTSSPASETSRLPATNPPSSSPAPLLRSSTTPKLEPIPSSAFGKKTTRSGVAQASYEQPVSAASSPSASAWQQR